MNTMLLMWVLILKEKIPPNIKVPSTMYTRSWVEGVGIRRLRPVSSKVPYTTPRTRPQIVYFLFIALYGSHLRLGRVLYWVVQVHKQGVFRCAMAIL